ncbi:MAG TPA: CPBP family intramembrane glutamic endopeptidase [Candidatus Nitrosopolaris sp.]|nr:CPBP family intramembrane glutamic endopeptidase [Candidatus Nitrosopolaris sp.]
MGETTFPETPPVLQTNAVPNQLQRCLQVVALVSIWMAVGWLFHLDADSYLVVGVPLVVAFQLLVRRKPLVALWVRDAEHFRLNVSGIVFGLGLAVLPTVKLIQTFRLAEWASHRPEILWYVCCIIGAFGAAFGFSRFTKRSWKELGFCAGTAGTIGCLTMLLSFLTRLVVSHLHNVPLTFTWFNVLAGLQSFVLYVPVCFVLEEVVFRGAIDSHVFQPGDKGQWWTAFFVSTLWGWWHLPIVDTKGILPLMKLIVLLPCIHIAVGVFLSLSWRRSGNLAVPATVHAFIDAVRNMLLQ